MGYHNFRTETKRDSVKCEKIVFEHEFSVKMKSLKHHLVIFFSGEIFFREPTHFSLFTSEAHLNS